MCKVYMIFPSKTLASFILKGRQYARISQKLTIRIFYFRSKYNIFDLLSLKKFSRVLLNLIKSDLVIFVSAPVTLSRIILYIVSKIFRKKVINYWIGTDVLLLRTHGRKFLRKILNKDRNIVVSKWLALELQTQKINVDGVYPIIPPDLLDILERPIGKREKAALVYIPFIHRFNFYYGPLILKLAILLPHVKFYIVGISEQDLRKILKKIPKNIRVLGWQPRSKLLELYQQVPILLRFTFHDGLPNMVLEALAFRLFVFTNVPFQDPAVVYFSKVDAKTIANKIREFLDKGLVVNEKAGDFLHREYNPKVAYDRLYEYIYYFCAQN